MSLIVIFYSHCNLQLCLNLNTHFIVDFNFTVTVTKLTVIVVFNITNDTLTNNPNEA